MTTTAGTAGNVCFLGYGELRTSGEAGPRIFPADNPHGGMKAVGLFTAALLVAGCGGHEAAPLAHGKLVYTEHCSSCHQPHGEGYAKVYPNLAGNPIVRLSDPEPVLEFVVNGRRSMPPFGNELSPKEIADVVTYIRQSWGNHASAVEPGQVR